MTTVITTTTFIILHLRSSATSNSTDGSAVLGVTNVSRQPCHCECLGSSSSYHYYFCYYYRCSLVTASMTLVTLTPTFLSAPFSRRAQGPRAPGPRPRARWDPALLGAPLPPREPPEPPGLSWKAKAHGMRNSGKDNCREKLLWNKFIKHYILRILLLLHHTTPHCSAVFSKCHRDVLNLSHQLASQFSALHP